VVFHTSGFVAALSHVVSETFASRQRSISIQAEQPLPASVRASFYIVRDSIRVMEECGMINFGNKLNESLLDVLTLNNKVIANNIANVDTPHYKTKEVVFQEELRRQLEKAENATIHMKRTNIKHIANKQETSGVPFQIKEMSHTVMNNNQNNVDIDYEMSSLAKNQLLYNIVVDRVSGYYSKHKKLLNDLK
jgi:flagellar basal-body rod protein FlgB